MSNCEIEPTINIEQANRQRIKRYSELLESSGIWSSEEFKFKRYRLRLSPDLFPLTESAYQELARINRLMYQKGGFLEGMINVYEASSDPKLTGFPLWGLLYRVLRQGVPKSEKGILLNKDKITPAVIRIDLAESSDSSFKIMEVEGDKTHAFGYSTIADIIRGQELLLPGIISRFAELTEVFETNGPVLLVVGQQERFYEPELTAFCNLATQETGTKFVMVPERMLKIDENGLYPEKDNPRSRLLINLPILTPGGPSGTKVNQKRILKEYQAGRIVCLIPPKRFLGNKALLGIVSNCDGNPELERIVREFVSLDALAQLREVIPDTAIIWTKNQEFWRNEFTKNPNDWVIKKTVSSGMKGVGLPSDPDRQLSMLAEAERKPGQYIIQRKVIQKKRIFSFAEPEDLDQVQRREMYTRIELFASSNGPASVLTTAREDTAVHGAPDAIQISAKLIGGNND